MIFSFMSLMVTGLEILCESHILEIGVGRKILDDINFERHIFALYFVTDRKN